MCNCSTWLSNTDLAEARRRLKAGDSPQVIAKSMGVVEAAIGRLLKGAELVKWREYQNG